MAKVWGGGCEHNNNSTVSKVQTLIIKLESSKYIATHKPQIGAQ